MLSDKTQRNTEQLNISISQELKKSLYEHCKNDDDKISNFVRRAIRKNLEGKNERNEPKKLS